MANDRKLELLSALGANTLKREELVRQLQQLEQQANGIKMELFAMEKAEGAKAARPLAGTNPNAVKLKEEAPGPLQKMMEEENKVNLCKKCKFDSGCQKKAPNGTLPQDAFFRTECEDFKAAEPAKIKRCVSCVKNLNWPCQWFGSLEVQSRSDVNECEYYKGAAEPSNDCTHSETHNKWDDLKKIHITQCVHCGKILEGPDGN